MARPDIPRRCTEAEFLALPESKLRIELIDGEVIVSPAPTNWHQVLVSRLHIALHAWAEANPPAFVGLSPFDVRIGPDRIVQPDLFVLLGGLPSVRDLLDRAPDLVVEVMSGSQVADRLVKRRLYEQAGVREYWMVDPENAQLEVVTGGMLSVHRDRFGSSVAPGLSLDVAALLRPL